MKWLSTPALAAYLLFVLAFALPASAGRSGGRIVFETNHFCGNMDCGRGDIATINPDGSGLLVLTRLPAAVRVSEYSPRWSPDGQEIAYMRPKHIQGQAGGEAQIWRMNADGTQQRAVTHLPRSGSIHLYGGDGTLLDWSPNARQILFTTYPSGNLYVANVRTGAVTVLKKTPFYSVSWATWSPNGRWIAFVETPRGGTAARAQIFLISTVTHRLRQLTHLPKGYTPMYPAWSPDSQRIAFNYRGIYVINADGTHLHSLRTERIASIEPSWSPDGNSIVFTNGNNLAVMNPNGFSRHLITHLPSNTWANSDPNW